MSVACVDSSCLVAFGEAGAAAAAVALREAERLVGWNLVEAELRDALAREGVTAPPDRLLEKIRWLHPDRPLSEELIRVFGAGRLRGADAWHLANALWARHDATDLEFLTLDEAQRAVARELGFPAPDLAR